MTALDRQRAFRELERLVSRVSGTDPALMRSLGSLRRLLEPLLEAPWEEQDRWLLQALGDGAAPPGALAAGLLALRLGTVATLSRETCLDLAEAGFHLRSDPARLAEERLRRQGGGALRAEVLRLLQCRAERLDGSGPLGLAGGDLDTPIRLFITACGFIEGTGGVRPASLTALAAVCSQPSLFSVEAARSLVQAISAIPLGSYVALSSGERGRVVGVRPDDALRPLVCVRLRADGSAAMPPLLHDESDAPPVAGLLEEPWAGAPAPHESAQAWLQRVHLSAQASAGRRPELSQVLRDGWDQSEPPASAVQAKDQARQAQEAAALLQRERADHQQRLDEDGREKLAEGKRRALQSALEQSAQRVEQDRELLIRTFEAAARQALSEVSQVSQSESREHLEAVHRAVEEGREQKRQVQGLEARYAAALVRLGLSRGEADAVVGAVPVGRIEEAWNQKVQELRGVWEELAQRQRQAASRRDEDLRKRAEQREKLRLRLHQARARHGLRAGELRAALDAVAAQTAELEQLPAARRVWLERREARARVNLNSVSAEVARFQAELAEMEGTEKVQEEKTRAAVALLRKETAGELRRIRAEAGLPQLRRRLAEEVQRLDGERGAVEEAMAAAEAERQTRSELLEESRAKAAADREARSKTLAALEAAVLEKRRRLEDLRRQTLDAAQIRQTAQGTARRSMAGFEEKAAIRLAQTRASLAARQAALKRSLADLQSETRQAASQRTAAMAAFQERRRTLEDELRRLRGEWGDLQGQLAAEESADAPLRQALEGALSELDLRLLEALFALDTTRKEAAALSGDHERRLADWQRATGELEALSGEFSRLSGETQPLLEQWRELSGQGLAGVSAVFREQIMARARELGVWTARLGEIDRRLRASREALETSVLAKCREAGLRALREGRLEEARASLRQALSLKADGELQALLDSL